jgi:hypothetical protein
MLLLLKKAAKILLRKEPWFRKPRAKNKEKMRLNKFGQGFCNEKSPGLTWTNLSTQVRVRLPRSFSPVLKKAGDHASKTKGEFREET